MPSTIPCTKVWALPRLWDLIRFDCRVLGLDAVPNTLHGRQPAATVDAVSADVKRELRSCGPSTEAAGAGAAVDGLFMLGWVVPQALGLQLINRFFNCASSKIFQRIQVCMKWVDDVEPC